MSLLERLGGRPPPSERESLRRNLRRLLAAHPGMAAAQPWLGVPVDPGAGPAGLEDLRAAIALTIRRGEPRLEGVRVEAVAGEDGQARIAISAEAGALRLALAAEAEGPVLRPLREGR